MRRCGWLVLILCLHLCMLSACRPLGSTRPVVKIGLLAPFDGAYRALGYHLLPAARLAAQEAQASGDLEGVALEWVVLDTHGDPAVAAQRAKDLAVDPAVVAVIGPVLAETVAAARPVLEEAGIPSWPLVPGTARQVAEEQVLPSAAAGMLRSIESEVGSWYYLDAPLPDADFVAAYGALTGTAPWPLDAQAYHATQAALRALPCKGGQSCSDGWDPVIALYQGVPGQYPGNLVRIIE